MYVLFPYLVLYSNIYCMYSICYILLRLLEKCFRRLGYEVCVMYDSYMCMVYDSYMCVMYGSYMCMMYDSHMCMMYDSCMCMMYDSYMMLPASWV